ncbi:RNA polymerase sigma factor [Niabella ginsengisoli]|uniref:RNA polymerase sigma factor n=1 Tax=Niabella ginsengisoli TaxID=522298 RepID=UPI0021D44EC3|nr:RNA polymerase sigma factor [Niabella ginsengisoli]
MDKKENAAILFRAVDKLPENQKIAFILSKVEGLSYQEISEIMQTSISAIESLLHRAKNNLKKILEG